VGTQHKEIRDIMVTRRRHVDVPNSTIRSAVWWQHFIAIDNSMEYLLFIV